MQIVFIVIWCLIAAVILFGITFHNEVVDDRQRQDKTRKSLIAIDGGKAKLRRRA
jgi:hypothetical protein